MGWTAKNVPNLSGKTAVVTGANGGLGLENARELARGGAHVVMAARDQKKAAAAEASIRSDVRDASLEIVELDLGSQASTKEAAAQIAAKHPAIDILINNAGLMAMPERKTSDGFEMQFGVNHLGHWTFTAILLPSVLRADSGRIVTVTSVAHHQGRRVNPDNPHLHGKYSPWGAYGQAKLANFHFGLGLHKQLDAAGLATKSLIAHPGLSNTDLQSTTVQEGAGGWVASMSHVLADKVGMSPAVGSRSQLRAAVDPDAKSGEFYGPLFATNGPSVKKPIFRRIGMQKSIDVLWMVSERETGVRVDVAQALATP